MVFVVLSTFLRLALCAKESPTNSTLGFLMYFVFGLIFLCERGDEESAEGDEDFSGDTLESGDVEEDASDGGVTFGSSFGPGTFCIQA